MLVCQSVNQAIVNFNIRYNFWVVRDSDFILGMQTSLLMSLTKVNVIMTLNVTSAFSDFAEAGAYNVVFHKYNLFI